VQKKSRINTQIEKRHLGWNPISIKKIIIVRNSKDTVLFSKKDGIWKKNNHFDAMGHSNQVINYLSTMSLVSTKIKHSKEDIHLFSIQTFDKNEMPINVLTIEKELGKGVCSAIVNNNEYHVNISNNQNKYSIISLLDNCFR